MAIDEKLNIGDELTITVYLTSAPATTTFVSAQDGTEHRYETRKALLVEYDTRLENVLIAQGVDKKDAEDLSRLFASGAEHVSFRANDKLYCYRRIEDHATTGFDKDCPKCDNDAGPHRSALVRTITYERMKPDKDGRY